MYLWLYLHLYHTQTHRHSYMGVSQLGCHVTCRMLFVVDYDKEGL